LEIIGLSVLALLIEGDPGKEEADLGSWASGFPIWEAFHFGKWVVVLFLSGFEAVTLE